MIRGDKKQKSNKTELEKRLTTLYHVSKHIPGCAELSNDFADCWSPAFKDDPNVIEEIDIALGEEINNWVQQNEDNPETISKILHPLRVNKKLRPVLFTLKALAHVDYKHYFDSDYKGLPTALAAPVPFFPINSNEGKFIMLSKPVIKKYGNNTEMKISGMAMRSDDIKTIFALLQLMKDKRTYFTRKNLSFFVTIKEIGEQMQISNPSCETTRDAIWNSLERIRSCTIMITNEKGRRKLGGIIDGAQDLEEDSKLEIEIFFDRSFIELINLGYVSFNPKIIYSLRGRELNLYYYLQRQREFNTYGTYGKLNPIGIFKIWDYANLDGVNKESSAANKRFYLKKALEGLQKHGVIKTFCIDKDKLVIGEASIKKAIEAKKKKEIKNNDTEKLISNCPYGHTFGEEFDEYNDCDDCELFDECEKACTR
ncbi:MAG: hypothetical protein JXB00_09455 [Bacteroidales bacterium]|nr:hypothetical protein [Bacteroidales bacterium]